VIDRLAAQTEDLREETRAFDNFERAMPLG
jgi:hypothetical protein